MARMAILIYKIYIHLVGGFIPFQLQMAFQVSMWNKITYFKIVKGLKILVPIRQRLKLHPTILKITKYTLLKIKFFKSSTIFQFK